MLLSASIVALSLYLPSSATPQKGSKVGKGISDYLPNFAETNFVISMANVYMQASSLVKSVNAAVNSMSTAVDQLSATKETAEDLWGSVQKLQNVNIYDMDSWAEGLSTLRYDVVGMGLMQMNNLLASAALNFADGTLGGYIKAANGLSYDARDAGVQHAFNAYYYQEDWATYKADNGLDKQTQIVQDKTSEREALQEQRENLRNWTCPSSMDKAMCDKALAANKVKVQAFNDQMDAIDKDIDNVTTKVSVGQLRKNTAFSQIEYLETALKKIHLSADDYSTAYQQINSASAALARKAQRFITGRLSSAQRDPAPRPASDMVATTAAELCKRPENLVAKPDGTTTCIYSDDDVNKAASPHEGWDRSDLEGIGPDNESPRDVSLSDFQKLKAELAYINLMQEQLLFDIEMDQAYLEISLEARKSVKQVDHRPRLRAFQEGLGLAAVIGDANGFTKSDISRRHNANYKPGVPWNMSQTLEDNLAK